MSDQQPESSGPRRSQRDKKTAKPFVSGALYLLIITITAKKLILYLGPSNSFSRKRKRADTDTENDAPDSSDVDDVEERDIEQEDGADEEHDEHKTPRGRKANAKSSPKGKSTPVAKKPRGEKNILPKLPKPATRRGRQPKEGEGVYDAEQVAKDTKISADNPLFSEYLASHHTSFC